MNEKETHNTATDVGTDAERATSRCDEGTLATTASAWGQVTVPRISGGPEYIVFGLEGLVEHLASWESTQMITHQECLRIGCLYV